MVTSFFPNRYRALELPRMIAQPPNANADGISPRIKKARKMVNTTAT